MEKKQNPKISSNISSSDLDQHFLMNENTAKKIVSFLNAKKEDIIVEIGPGKGALTRQIPLCKTIIAIEKDETLMPELRMLENDCLKVIHANALSELKKHKFNKLLSNTPYAIIEPLFQRLFFTQFEIAVIVVGAGTAKHLQEDNLFSLLANSFLDIEYLLEIDRGDFFPIPKTESNVLRLKKNTEQGKKEFVRAIYTQNDKLLKNALREYFTRTQKLTKNKAREKIAKLKLNETMLDKLVSKISFEEWKELIKNI